MPFRGVQGVGSVPSSPLGAYLYQSSVVCKATLGRMGSCREADRLDIGVFVCMALGPELHAVIFHLAGQARFRPGPAAQTSLGMNNTEHFQVEGFMRWAILASPWICLALVVLGLSFPYLPNDGKPRNEAFELGFSIFLSVFFGVLAVLSWRMVRELPHAAVSVNSHGIWRSADDPGSSLVRWSEVSKLRERPYLQRLELLDRSGKRLLKLEYQLHSFERLRSVVLERSSLAPVRTELGQTFAKGVSYHAFNAAALVGFVALGLYVWPINALLAAAALLSVVGLGAWEYLTTAHKVELLPTELLITWPLKKLALSRTEIVALEVSDVFVNHARHPQVLLTHKCSTKPVALRGLGASAVELKLALEAWLRNAA